MGRLFGPQERVVTNPSSPWAPPSKTDASTCSGLSGPSAKSDDDNRTKAFCGTKACDHLTFLRCRSPRQRGGTEVFASTPELTRTMIGLRLLATATGVLPVRNKVALL